MRSDGGRGKVILTNDNLLLQTALHKAIAPFSKDTQEMILKHVKDTHNALEFEDNKKYPFPSQEAIQMALLDLFGATSIVVSHRIKAFIEQSIMHCKCDICGHGSRLDCINNKCSCCDVEDQFAILARAETPS